jgi:ParB-like chromosome segregation protein Spo0J
VILNESYALVPLDHLTEHPENPNDGDVDAIAASIDANGFYGAVVAQKSTGHVLAGNHRLAAARAHGLDALPVVWVDVDDDRARRIMLADNRTAELAHRDPEALTAILSALNDTDEALRGTGYVPEDLEDLLALIAGPPDLDDLAAAWEDRESADEAVVIRVTDPGVAALWRGHRAGFDTDAAALADLLPPAA